MSHRVSLLNKTFGLLTVVERLGKNRFGNSMWLCRCKCGKTREALYQHLCPGKGKTPAVYSCGCTRRPR